MYIYSHNAQYMCISTYINIDLLDPDLLWDEVVSQFYTHTHTFIYTYIYMYIYIYIFVYKNIGQNLEDKIYTIKTMKPFLLASYCTCKLFWLCYEYNYMKDKSRKYVRDVDLIV